MPRDVRITRGPARMYSSNTYYGSAFSAMLFVALGPWHVLSVCHHQQFIVVLGCVCVTQEHAAKCILSLCSERYLTAAWDLLLE